ncbi:hypothetical protein ACLIKD_02610 [Azonexus sp. IMCC34842]|uniref:hypothetical protein n=1 Tax=Azonexus sp. IMCC34842 TaxID=3420950 RepID=UPI003D11DD58
MSDNPNDQDMHVRANKDLAAAVERGLAVALLNGLSAGALAMDVEGVPLNIATRVLLHPERCRATDWHH